MDGSCRAGIGPFTVPRKGKSISVTVNEKKNTTK